jgi:hypothetical protein
MFPLELTPAAPTPAEEEEIYTNHEDSGDEDSGDEDSGDEDLGDKKLEKKKARGRPKKISQVKSVLEVDEIHPKDKKEPADAPAEPADAPAEPADVNVGGKEIVVVCQDCKVKFPSQKKAEQHGKEMGHRPFECQFCYFTCLQKCNLTTHEGRHQTANYEHNGICQECGYKDTNLNYHGKELTRVVDGKEVKHHPYRCMKCENYTAIQAAHMQTHMYTCKGQLHNQGIFNLCLFVLCDVSPPPPWLK